MVSYLRARSEGLGVPGDVGLMGRPERIVVLGAGLLLGREILIRRGKGPSWLPRGFDVGLAILGLLAAAGYWNLLQFHYPMFGHSSDTYHYYVGGKYYPELGHTRLYLCTAIADAEAVEHDQADGSAHCAASTARANSTPLPAERRRTPGESGDGAFPVPLPRPLCPGPVPGGRGKQEL